MNASDPNASAVQIGRSLNDLLKRADAGPLDPAETETLFGALVTARCETPADFLAVVAHANDLVRQARAYLQENESLSDPQCVAQLLIWVTLLNTSAIASLEALAGQKADAFLGAGPTIN